MKTAVVTGANKSIGFETAKQLIDLGYFVYLGSRDLEKGKAAVEKLNADQAEAFQIDVSDEQSTIDASRLISGKIKSLDALINNAGISGGFPQSALNIDTKVLREVFDTNFFGTVNVTKAFLDLLKKSPEPRIVNVTSGLASLTLHSDPSWMHYNVKSAAYGPSKTALNAYTTVLAYELKDTAFKVNVIDPGYTATDFNHYDGGGTVENAGKIIVKYATLNAIGPTGKFFSNESEADDDQLPW